MKLIITFYTILIFAHGSEASTLGIKKYIELSQKNDPSFNLLMSEKLELEYIVDEGLPSRQVTLSLSSQNGYSSDSDQNTASTIGEISKDLIETGTTIAVSNTKTTRPDRKENVTEVRLEQSLYKNMFGRDVRLKKESLTEQQKLKSLEIKENLEKYYVILFKKYLELSKLYREYKLSEKVLMEAKKLTLNVKKQVKSKVASMTDLKRSQLLVLLKQEEVVSNQSTFNATKSQIEQSIKHVFDSFSEKDTEKLISLLESTSNKLSDISWEQTRTGRIAKHGENFSEKEMILQDRVDSPNLNFVLGYNKDDSQRFGTTIKRDETVVGLKLDIPFGDTQSKAKYNIAKVNYLKAQMTKKNEAVEYEKRRALMRNDLKQSKDQLKIDAMKVKLTKEILKEEEKRFAIGRIELEKLIELKNDYSSYRANQEQSKLTYGIALLEWLELNDALSGIELERKL